MADAGVNPDPSRTDEFDPVALRIEEALERIESAVRPVSGFESVALRSALGRILGADVRSPVDVPGHANSAMDGYAVIAADIPAAGDPAELEVIGTSWAGKPFTERAAPGQCVRIMTGGLLPPGTDAVVMQENVERDGDVARIGPGVAAGDYVRAAGEDLRAGEIVLTAGKRVLPPELGMLASMGLAEVRVRRRPRVAFFSTGDELRSIGEPAPPGTVYDSNRYTLFGVLDRLGVEMLDMGIVRDEREALRRAFAEASDNADAVITSGGVSVGEADFVKETLHECGEVKFWKIAMKPGRPLAFGFVGDTVFFGLPGNPVSVMVTFYQFVQPALRRMMGETATRVPRMRVPCASRLTKRPGRVEFQRGVLDRTAGGDLVVHSTGEQGSGVLHSMNRANCFIVLPLESEGAAPGDRVLVEPFFGLV